MQTEFDIVIIGGGAAGLIAAETAVSQGARTCLIEKNKLGGDRTWRGCIPSKALLKSAQIADSLRHHADFGLRGRGDFSFDYSEVMGHVRHIREQIGAKDSAENFRHKGVEVIEGAASFIGPAAVEVAGRTITAEKFVLCTGTHPAVPPIEGLKEIEYLTNETVFELARLPQSLLVLGGGPIGIELAQALSRLGVQVTVVEMMDRILSVEDLEISEFVAARLKDEGLAIMTGYKAVKFSPGADGVTAVLENSAGETIERTAAQLLVAIGRAPNIEGLSLEKGGIEYTKKGIGTDEHLRTTNTRVYACGDVVGPYMFTHVAAYQAHICIRNTLFRKIFRAKVDYGNVAWADYIDPEIGHLGLTEEQAREKYAAVKVYRNDYSITDRAITDHVGPGFLKVITAKNGYILGAHAVGAAAAEIIHPLVIAKAMKIKFSKLTKPMFIYPTLSELVQKTAALAREDFLNRPAVKFFLKLTKTG
jgi:pyruvate/2-oxoglutarate dehydrogenase complex dihydrolipoamide dehydrogenase (E3) component